MRVQLNHRDVIIVTDEPFLRYEEYAAGIYQSERLMIRGEVEQEQWNEVDGVYEKRTIEHYLFYRKISCYPDYWRAFEIVLDENNPLFRFEKEEQKT